MTWIPAPNYDVEGVIARTGAGMSTRSLTIVNARFSGLQARTPGS